MVLLAVNHCKSSSIFMRLIHCYNPCVLAALKNKIVHLKGLYPNPKKSFNIQFVV